MAKAILTEAALADYEKSLAWYLERSERAAIGFEAAVQEGVSKILANPDRYAKCGRQHRYHILKRYPYSIIYRIVGEDIEIAAIAHGKRRPNYWRR